MTVKEWLDLAITIISFLLTVIAGVYAKEKTKINKQTSAGKAMDVLGQLATAAVHEAEYSGLDNEAKRTYASEVINQGLQWFGIKDVTPNLINGAIENAVNSMHLANSVVGSNPSAIESSKLVDAETQVEEAKSSKIEAEDSGEIAKDVPVDDVVQPEKIDAENLKVGGQDD